MLQWLATTDAKHKLIVDFDLTNQPNDYGSLQTMSKKAQEVMEVKALTNIADKGFYVGSDIAACEQDGVRCLVAKPQTTGPKQSEEFKHERFVYDCVLDCYVCPAQNQLQFRRMDKQRGEMHRAYENYAACRACQKRPECTKNSYRRILRSPFQDALDVVNVRTKTNRALYRRRSEIVEHPFGTIKAVWGFKQFLCRGLMKVTAETALAYLAPNFRRVFNIFAADGVRLAKIFSR
jgi:hypothetical protein